jgi:hypothetical protein
MSHANLAQWRPRELLLNVQQQTLDEFVAECESPYLLLIRLEDLSSELALGLATQEPREQGRDGLGFRTVQRNVSDVIAAVEAAKKTKELAIDRRAALRLSARPGRSGGLPAEVCAATCHVLPLRKRSEAAFLRSVSVGRARNHDIVLRHRSVSKFHGSFDFDEQGRLFVRDANSSNHTFVNGMQLGDRAEVHAGDDVQFGSVATHLCRTEDFWRTLQR